MKKYYLLTWMSPECCDKAFHGTAFISPSKETVEFKCRPNVGGICNKLADFKKRFPDYKIQLCYEATYIGFTLQRDLAKKS